MHHKFEVDESAVATFIHSQNGCPGRAIVELVTNAIDAGSTKCSIQLTENGFSITDNGSGFGTYNDVMQYFKRFGTPHEDEEAVFGRFRLGRGQIMQFGKVMWQSNSHEMRVDIKNNGYGFEYRELVGDELVDGCGVKGGFYKSLDSWSLYNAKRVIVEICRYLNIPIFMNGEQLNGENDLVWDYEDNDMRIQWKKNDDDANGIRIYNQGALVKEIARHVYGFGADLVTKTALKLNVSRNDIVTTDPLWTSIDKVLLTESAKHRKRQAGRKRMNENMRQSISEQLMAGVIDFHEVCGLPLLRDARGRYITINSLSDRPITLSPGNNNLVAETIIMQKIAMVLHHAELQFWRSKSLQELFHYLLIKAPYQSSDKYANFYRRVYDKLNFIDFSVVAAKVSTEKKLVPNKELKPRESAARNSLQYASGVMAKRISNAIGNKVVKRKIVVGECSDAEGWTDAQSFIAINRNMLVLLDQGRHGALQLAALMLHEYCHNKEHPDSDTHGEVFYERYHELSLTHGKNEILGNTASSLFNQYSKHLINKYEPLPDAVISEYNWPVINEQQEFECVLSSKKLSQFAKLVLEISGVKVKLSSRKLKISYPKARMGEIFKRIDSYLNKVVIPGVNMASVDSITRGVDFRESGLIVRKHIIKAATEWSSKNNYDPGAASMFFLREKGSDSLLAFLLQVICKDSHSGVQEYTSTALERSITIGGPNYHYDGLSPWQVSGYTTDGYRREMISGMKINLADRNAFAIARLKEIILSIRDKKERRRFLNDLFNEEFSAQFLVNMENATA